MKYRLKDKARWKAKKQAFPDFERNLQKSCEGQWDDETSTIVIQDGRRYLVLLAKEDIERYDNYDPNTWNEYPDVTPPEGVWMRVEDEYGRGFKSFWSEGHWNRDSYVSDRVLEVARFRPWVDPDEEGSACGT